jgi:hypothetical protein
LQGKMNTGTGGPWLLDPPALMVTLADLKAATL